MYNRTKNVWGPCVYSRGFELDTASQTNEVNPSSPGKNAQRRTPRIKGNPSTSSVPDIFHASALSKNFPFWGLRTYFFSSAIQTTSASCRTRVFGEELSGIAFIGLRFSFKLHWNENRKKNDWKRRKSITSTLHLFFCPKSHYCQPLLLYAEEIYNWKVCSRTFQAIYTVW